MTEPEPTAAGPAETPDEFRQALQELVRQMGLPAVGTDDQGLCTLTFNGTQAVNIGPGSEPGSLVLFAALPQLAAAQMQQARRHLLAAGYLPEGEPIGWAVHPVTGQCVLMAHRPSTDAGTLSPPEWVEAFVDHLASWRQALFPADVPSTLPALGGELPMGSWIRG